MSDLFQLLYHLFCGFIFFLGRNLARMNFNADTLVPGLAAYGLCVIALHILMKRVCRVREKPWSFLGSCIVSLLLPALFAISVLVPGVIFQIQQLLKNS
jgi:hypothetical protein